MADSLGNRVIVVDLASGTKRLLRADMVEIESIVIDGTSAAGVIQLKEGGTNGNVVYQITAGGATLQHINDYTCSKVSKGLYIAAATDADFTAWASGAVMLIYTK